MRRRQWHIIKVSNHYLDIHYSLREPLIRIMYQRLYFCIVSYYKIWYITESIYLPKGGRDAGE